MTMQVTHAQNQADLEEIADLKGKIFKRASYYDFYEERMRLQTLDPWFKPEHALIIKDKGRIVSQVTIFDRPIRFGPARLKMAGIGDVFTVPDYRGKGCSHLLMLAALDYMAKENFDLSLLFGIPNYYHKYGYIEAMKNYQLEVFGAVETPKQSAFRCKEFRPEDLQGMLRLYNENIKDASLVVDRTVEYWQSKAVDPAHLLLIIDTEDRLAGYACTWDPINSQFMVIEAVSTCREASFCLLAEISRRKPATEPTLKIKMSPQMPFVHHLRFLGTELKSRCFAEGEGKGMLAIVDLYRLLNKLTPLLEERLAFSSFCNYSGEFTIAGSQSVQLSFEEGSMRVGQNGDPVSSAIGRLQTNLNYFVRNIVGFWSVQDLLDQTPAKVSDNQCLELLQILFPETNAFLLPLDYF